MERFLRGEGFIPEGRRVLSGPGRPLLVNLRTKGVKLRHPAPRIRVKKRTDVRGRLEGGVYTEWKEGVYHGV